MTLRTLKRRLFWTLVIIAILVLALGGVLFRSAQRGSTGQHVAQAHSEHQSAWTWPLRVWRN